VPVIRDDTDVLPAITARSAPPSHFRPRLVPHPVSPQTPRVGQPDPRPHRRRGRAARAGAWPDCGPGAAEEPVMSVANGRHTTGSRTVAGARPVVLLRYRPGVTGQTARVVHLVPLPAADQIGVAFRGALLRRDLVETTGPGQGTRSATSPPEAQGPACGARRALAVGRRPEDWSYGLASGPVTSRERTGHGYPISLMAEPPRLRKVAVRQSRRYAPVGVADQPRAVAGMGLASSR